MRIDGWSDALIELIHEAESRRFRWGAWDCCQFGARVIAASTGCDPRSIFPPYRTKAQAEMIIADCGGMEALITKAVKEPAVHPAFAHRGAIVLGDFARGRRPGMHALTPGLCWGVWSLSPGRGGLERLETLKCVRAWNVGLS